MTRFKFKQIAIVMGLMVVGMTSAQSSRMNHMLKVGADGGFAVGKVAKISAGANVSYQYLIRPGLGIGLASGYTHFFGKSNEFKNEILTYKIENNDFGIVPIAALLRVYPKKMGFYAGADLGYAFITGNGKVLKNERIETHLVYSIISSLNENRPKGGVYLRPEIGWHNRDWNVYVHYTAVLTGDKGDIKNSYNKENLQNYTIGSIGLGVAYNIPLGK